MRFHERILDEFFDIAVKKDYFAKGICLLLSIILWAYINYSRTGEMKFRVPLVLQNLSEDMAITEISSQYATIVIDGEKERLQNVDVKQIKTTVDLKNPEVDVLREYQVKLLYSELPEGIHVYLKDRAVRIKVEEKVSKKIPVEPVLTEKLPDGYVLGQVLARPETVFVRAAKSRVEAIDVLKTRPISLKNEKESIIKNIEIDTEAYAGIEFNTAVVQVVLPVYSIDELENIEVPLVLKNMPPDYMYEIIDKVAVFRIKLPEDESVDEDDIDAYIDMTGINPETLIKKNNGESITIKQPLKYIVKKKVPGLNILEISPSVIQVKISPK